MRQRAYALKEKIVDYAIPRYLVKDEFHKIWDTQAQYFSQMRKEGLKQEVYDILFYERPAAPYAVGKCIYFRDEDRLLKRHRWLSCAVCMRRSTISELCMIRVNAA